MSCRAVRTAMHDFAAADGKPPLEPGPPEP